MNNPNPFVPKGSLLEQQSLRRSRLKIAVGCVLVVSVSGLVATLIVGCHRENPESQTPPADTNTSPVVETANTNYMPGMPGNVAAQPTIPSASNPAPVSLPPVPTPVQPVAPTPAPEQPAASTYEVVSGDTLGKIAKAHGVTLKALEAANPGVDSKKLHPKQKINIPAPTASATSTQNGTATDTGGQIYAVKPGDNMTKIAKAHGVTLKALKAANPKVDPAHIKVGDKLTIPAKAETAAPTTPATDTMATPTLPPTSPLPTTNTAQ